MNPNTTHDEAHDATDPLTFEEEAQQVLTELWSEKLLPFQMNVGKITKSVGYYTIHFYDSRICSARVVLTTSQSFREMIRDAVLARVSEMSGQLHRPAKN